MKRKKKVSSEYLWKTLSKILFSVLVVVIVKSVLVSREHKKLMQKYNLTLEVCADSWLKSPLTKAELDRVKEVSK
jgi:hypothetical protein